MNKSFSLFIVVFLIYGCLGKHNKIEKLNVKPLSNYIESFSAPVFEYEISVTRDTVLLFAENYALWIPKNSILTSQKEVLQGKAKIYLSMFYNTVDILGADLTTLTKDNYPLGSEGMIKLEIKDRNAENLQIDSSKNWYLEIYNKNSISKDILLFKGEFLTSAYSPSWSNPVDVAPRMIPIPIEQLLTDKCLCGEAKKNHLYFSNHSLSALQNTWFCTREMLQRYCSIPLYWYPSTINMYESSSINRIPIYKVDEQILNLIKKDSSRTIDSLIESEVEEDIIENEKERFAYSMKKCKTFQEESMTYNNSNVQIIVDTAKLIDIKKRLDNENYLDTINTNTVFSMLASNPILKSFNISKTGWYNIDYLLDKESCVEWNIKLLQTRKNNNLTLFCYLIFDETKTIISQKYQSTEEIKFINKLLLPKSTGKLLIIAIDEFDGSFNIFDRNLSYLESNININNMRKMNRQKITKYIKEYVQ